MNAVERCVTIARSPKAEIDAEESLDLSWMGVADLQKHARLGGRHGRTWWDTTGRVRMNHFTPAEVARIRASFDEGVDLRRRSVRCYCDSCINPPRIVENERKRLAYASRRRAELTAEGYRPAEVDKRVLEEIDRGMAL